MTIDIQYRGKQFGPSYNTFAKALDETLRALFAMARKNPDSSETEKLAIAILTRADSSLDEREWAERYLCGMVNADISAFGTDRKAQS